MTSTSADLSGVYRQETAAWSWYWQNGTLVGGTVPWANISGKPTTLTGYGITDAAPIASPAFTGTPTAPTPAVADSSTKLATTAYVQSALASGGDLQSTTAISPVAVSELRSSKPAANLAAFRSPRQPRHRQRT
ncbi:MAG TPA: hypothetical protein VGQ76_18925 [Thermoanaerobaculia bacterium]|nr:hypothetical protein [Thermoanaerobaculia bacterium]